MDSLDERDELGTIAVEADVLAQSGIELDAMLAELQVALAGEIPADTPRVGWRVLTAQNGAAQTVGAPTDFDGQWWRIGLIRRDQGEGMPHLLELHPTSQRRRPSKKDRAGGLVLRWPAVTRSAPDLDLLGIDIVNAGEERWHPHGDSFTVFAALGEPGAPAPGVSFAYVAGQSPALPLDPGEYARVRVVVDSGQWRDAHPGPCEVHACLVDLGLRGGEPLHVELTERDIHVHQPRKRPLAPPSP
ncbi:hypothetical protein [Cryobacterium sp. PAMC25264]|uniref:hypothetical protein n=1 Tax=Cryobacterium sp. PAMC25264 TaxID=2861288 RepID=UPI001C63186A|nr:hypothetical protein [Cryobacterium sp. PAMC25264]QYF72282.1 hypothetical protein KY500_10490 [Cryobacterium sp. PAMC25264]